MSHSIQIKRLGFLYLAGGTSQRMGEHKSQLLFDDRTLLERALFDVIHKNKIDAATISDCVINLPSALDGAIDQSLFSSSNECRISVVYDARADGPLGGLADSFKLFESRKLDAVLVYACDTLILPSSLARLLLKAFMINGRSVYLEHQTSIFPLIGMYRLEDLQQAQQALMSGQHRVMAWLAELDAQSITAPDAWSDYLQFNTPDEYAAAKVSYRTSAINDSSFTSI